MSVFDDVFSEYGAVVQDIQLAKMKNKSSGTMAYYDSEDNIAINESYFNSKKMDKAYAECVKSGFHPSNGNKTGLQAVVAHELGHKLTNDVSVKLGNSGWTKYKDTAKLICEEARKKTGHKGVIKMAEKISGYAKYSNSECIAEAFSDVFCNGKKAHKESLAIVDVINSYLK